MIIRQLGSKILDLSSKLPIVLVTGPRQSGKTTLLKYLFPKLTYVSLEDPDIRSFAQDDPRGFLTTYKSPVILDEVQQVPNLFSYLQTTVDNLNLPGQFILSGSQNFLLLEKASQSLAGRVGIVNLLPLTFNELEEAKLLPDNPETAMLYGFYPRIWDKKLTPADWYPSYIQTYLERDIRQIKEITNLSLFQKFLRLCAGRTGQILNLSSLGVDLGISHNTVRSWLSVLEASFIIFLLKPYFANINKRLIKTPKLYFFDIGLACSLLSINTPDQITTHPLKGALFETLIASEIQKIWFHQGSFPQHYFLQDKQGHEIDYLAQSEKGLTAIEIKSGQTVSSQYFSNLTYWQKTNLISKEQSFVIFAGKQNHRYQQNQVIPWNKTSHIFSS
jgi:hypothetical protein